MSEQEHSRTEDATPYKLDQARKKGLVARSQDLGVLAGCGALAGYWWVFGDGMARKMAVLSQQTLAQAGQVAGPRELWLWSNALLAECMHIVAPVLWIIAGIGLMAILAQVGFLFAPAALKPDFTRLSPTQGLKKIFSLQILIEAGKSILKLMIYSIIVYLVIRSAASRALYLVGEPANFLNELAASGLHLLLCLLAVAAVIAAIDQVIVRRQFAGQMRMSRREMKDEVKQREGEPRIKQRRKQLQMELLKRTQSMRNLRGADVLIANPTHFAIGLKYDADAMSAPMVVAKGAGDFAQRLKRIAFIYGVPIIEDRRVARQLFFKGRIEQEVPETLYRDVSSLYLRLRTLRGRAQQGAR
ncbi:EscU/YscU/HrcU family type III secretion system export apparatus switch protein [Paraherbaspirillum soli]|uniref:Flagellar biosynthesis protein FlhB n=1 Tax=Paraherbaspirillum soli TaxID=631222 RepID=A0ABW0MC62_9BURK